MYRHRGLSNGTLRHFTPRRGLSALFHCPCDKSVVAPFVLGAGIHVPDDDQTLSAGTQIDELGYRLFLSPFAAAPHRLVEGRLDPSRSPRPTVPFRHRLGDHGLDTEASWHPRHDVADLFSRNHGLLDASDVPGFLSHVSSGVVGTSDTSYDLAEFRRQPSG